MTVRGFVAVLVAGLGVGVFALRGSTRGPEAPVAVPNPQARPPEVTRVGSVRQVLSPAPVELLVPDTVRPRGRAVLLWFNGRQTRAAGRERVVVDGNGGALLFNDRLTARRFVPPEGVRITSIAVSGDETVWLTDEQGRLLRRTKDGALREITSPFPAPVVAAAPAGDRAWVVRSAEDFPSILDTADSPVAVELAPDGRETRAVGRAHRPAHVLLGELENSGFLAVSADRVFFAPFIHDQIVAFGPRGDTLWIATRGLPQDRGEPRFEVQDGQVRIDYHPVNLGAVVGPDGLLYVLSTPGFTTMESRLDAFDPATGVLRRSVRLNTAQPTVAVARDGRVHLLDPLELLTGVSERAREVFPQFAMAVLDGDSLSSGDVLGKVVLVNFWASWCTPCRTEMPALDTLRRRLEADTGFRFLAFNDEADAGAARRFVTERGFGFPVLLGHGNLRVRYHYIGLPYTVLLDRTGRIVKRWIGFAGPEQIEDIAALVRSELRRGPDGADAHHHGSHPLPPSE